MKTLSIIIPVYNEASSIAHVLDSIHRLDLALGKEVIVVDDGSTDRTAEIVRANMDKVHHLHRSQKNFGKGAAVRIGMTYAKGDFMIIQDADAELDPREYPRLVAPILDGRAQVVYGSRFLTPNRGISARTRAANAFLTFLTNLLYGSRLTDMETAYKVFRRSAVRGLELECLGFEFEPEITAKLLRSGLRIHEVPVGYRPRTREEGKKIGWQDGLIAVANLIKYRFAPVRWDRDAEAESGVGPKDTKLRDMSRMGAE